MIGYRNHFLPIYDKLSNFFLIQSVSLVLPDTLSLTLSHSDIAMVAFIVFSLHMNAVLAEVKTWNTDKV